MYPKLLAGLSLTIAFAVGPPIAAEPKHGDFNPVKIKVGSAEREYRLIVPKSVDLKKPAPLVISFHGMLIDSKELMPRYTKFPETAAKHEFLLCYPDAVGRSWGIAPDKVANDLEFFDALLKKIQADYVVDPQRIYVMGMSNGGYWAHLVAKERSRTIAACASHSGPLGLQTLLGVRAERKFPVMIVHGDKDGIMPIAWARENRDKYQREGHEVKYVEVAGLNHFWATDAKINEQIWDFFEKHPLPKK